MSSQDVSEAIVVFMTAANGEEAARLADMLVGAHLAACVQILPEMESVYRWQGKIERQAEILLLAKTTRAKFDELEREVRALHSYDTPEIIAVPDNCWLRRLIFNWLSLDKHRYSCRSSQRISPRVRISFEISESNSVNELCALLTISTTSAGESVT